MSRIKVAAGRKRYFVCSFRAFLYPKPAGFQSVPRVAPLSTVGVATHRKRPRAAPSRAARKEKRTPYHKSDSSTREIPRP
ncbi:unnamed protein product, partial [Iphiclides podalirius]